MSNQRFTPEFKDEAVRQVLDKDHTVAAVSERLGVSTHSLDKRVNAVKPNDHEAQANELLEAKSEVLTLRAQRVLLRLWLERISQSKFAFSCFHR